MNATDIGHSDASQNYEKMGSEFILPLLFNENIDILLLFCSCRNVTLCLHLLLMKLSQSDMI
jgi:hypothetical protein